MNSSEILQKSFKEFLQYSVRKSFRNAFGNFLQGLVQKFLEDLLPTFSPKISNSLCFLSNLFIDGLKKIKLLSDCLEQSFQ